MRSSLVVHGIAKQFNRKSIFRDVSFAVHSGQVFGITGRNGSGKSTLLKIIGSVLGPTAGTVSYTIQDAAVDAEQIYRHIGYCAPYLALFDEFSAEENIRLFADIRGIQLEQNEIVGLLERVGLPTDRKDPIRAFSSGMKQRMKLIFSIVHQPSILLLDEPISNLDTDGVQVVYAIVREYKAKGCVLIATNDQSDIDQCDDVYSLNTTDASW